MTVYLRNVHPKQIVYLPVRPGWARVLRPAVTTAVPETAMHHPAVRALLLHRMVDLVDGAAWDPDVRQRRASRADMARAIAAAEQAEFDKLRTGFVSQYIWSPARLAWLRDRLATGAPVKQLAAEAGITPSAMRQLCQRHGLGRPARRRFPA